MSDVTCPNCGHDFWVATGYRGKANPNWKGGEHRKHTGYVESTLTAEEAARYPTARRISRSRRASSYVIQRSHLVWNRAHPDDLVQPGEQMHHVNRVRDDDRLENLRKVSRTQHDVEHALDRREASIARWDRVGRKHPDRPCENCGKTLTGKQRSVPTARFCSQACKSAFRRGKPRVGY